LGRFFGAMRFSPRARCYASRRNHLSSLGVRRRKPAMKAI